jgi:hypothetical protein
MKRNLLLGAALVAAVLCTSAAASSAAAADHGFAPVSISLDAGAVPALGLSGLVPAAPGFAAPAVSGGVLGALATASPAAVPGFASETEMIDRTYTASSTALGSHAAPAAADRCTSG